MKPLRVHGTELWCEDRGSGLPLLLVHGFPLDHSMWADLDIKPRPVVAASADPRPVIAPDTPPGGATTGRGFMSNRVRLIAPDLRGFGRSVGSACRAGPLAPSRTSMAANVPPGRRDLLTVSMEQFADDLAALLDALEIAEPVVLCGLSMGGYIALQFWRKYPARLRALILCDTRAAPDSPEAVAGRYAMAKRVLREGAAPVVDSMLPRVLGETARRNRPELVEAVRRTMMSASPQAMAAALRGMAQRPDMTAALQEIRCPTLVLVGAEDVASTPAEMRGMAQAIPNAKFVEVPAAGHLSPLENPAAFNAAITEFLREPGKGTGSVASIDNLC